MVVVVVVVVVVKIERKPPVTKERKKDKRQKTAMPYRRCNGLLWCTHADMSGKQIRIAELSRFFSGCFCRCYIGSQSLV